MISIKGKYENGAIELAKKIISNKSIDVIVTFLDEELEEDNEINISNFSFLQSQNKLKKYTDNFSDTIIEERKSYL